jgi:hypothetical protein
MRSRVFPLAIISLFTPICFVALQTPYSTQAALAAASQLVQDRAWKEVPAACPATKPPAQPFMPPPPYWTDHGPDRFWYGTESLWTLLDVPGTWRMGGGEVYTTKLVYWRRGLDSRKEPEPELIVTASRLDRQVPLVVADHANAVFVTGPQPAAMMTMIDIPTTGCWEVTARHRDQKLSFVVSVQP